MGSSIKGEELRIRLMEINQEEFSWIERETPVLRPVLQSN